MSKNRQRPELRLFEVRGSEPPTEDRRWRRNFAAMVLAPTLGEAVAHVAATRPEGTEIHDAMSRSGGRPVEWAVTPQDGQQP